MVKNAGGNRGKKIGRKHLGGPKGTRTRSEDGEIYACVVKLYGGANCEVLCEDGKSRLCIIRNKFRGRGKRGNILSPGVWVMVGDRSWEGTSDGKLEKCDLLEVYNEADKKKLRSDDPSGKWDVLDTADPEKDSDATKYDHITFDDVLRKGLKVMDTTAFTLSQENELPIIVFDMNTNGNLIKLLNGEQIGTKVQL